MSDPGAEASSLQEAAASFASELQDTLDGVLPGERTIVSTGTEGGTRFVVSPEGRREIPLFVAGEPLANLKIAVRLSLDRSGKHLKSVGSDFEVRSVLGRQPLLRLDYMADMSQAPMAHWQIHAERGAFSHLLARAHAHQPNVVTKPHELSSLHIPVGGERFRPCLEDFLQFLVQECGVDANTGWKRVVEAGREGWRRRQLRATVRDAQEDAAEALRKLGWTVTAGPDVNAEPYLQTLRHW